jgi:hypothetical protein
MKNGFIGFFHIAGGTSQTDTPGMHFQQTGVSWYRRINEKKG